MSNLYDALLAALREHWQTHANAYPQCFELTHADWQALNAQRKLVNDTMNFRQASGWEQEFHGVPLRAAPSNAMVAVTGERVSVLTVVDPAV